MRCFKGSLIGLIVLSLILLASPSFFNYVKSAENVVTYRYSVSDWYGWVLEIAVEIPRIIRLGSIATLNISISVVERGLGDLLSITSLAISIGKVSVSNYVGILNSAGETISRTLLIPVSVDSSLPPGTAFISSMQIFLQGYIEFSNSTRKQVYFSQTIPITLFVPLSQVIAFIYAERIDGNVLLNIRVENTEIEAVYDTYVSIFVNNSLYKTIYIASIPGNGSRLLTEFLSLKPGVYVVRAVINYTTSYGVSRSLDASTRVVIPIKPNIKLEVNSTSIAYMQSVLITGCVYPGTRLGILLEYSLNGFEWFDIASVESREEGCFQYIWKPPTVSNTLYVRARVIATEFYEEAISDAVVIRVSKIKPTIKVIINASEFRIGDPYPRIAVLIEPPMELPVTIVYREPGSQTWIVYASMKTDESGKLLVPPMRFFSKPGTYVFKAIANQTNITDACESNEVAVSVQQPESVSSVSSLTQISERGPLLSKLGVNTIVVIITVSIVFAILLFAIGRRR